MPRQQHFNILALRLFIYCVHGHPRSIPSALSSS
jgi:hypothetical protein